MMLTGGHQTRRRRNLAQIHGHLKLNPEWPHPLYHREVESGLVEDLDGLDSGHGSHGTPRFL